MNPRQPRYLIAENDRPNPTTAKILFYVLFFLLGALYWLGFFYFGSE